MTTLTESFGQTHFGTAQPGRLAGAPTAWSTSPTASTATPARTLPHKLHDPAAYKAMDRLVNRPEATHAAVLEPAPPSTPWPAWASPTLVVLVLHDTTELDYSGLRSISDLGPIGGGLNRGYLCHNSLAVDGQRHEVVGLANQIPCTAAATSARRSRSRPSVNGPIAKAGCGSTAATPSARRRRAAAGCMCGRPRRRPPSSSWPDGPGTKPHLGFLLRSKVNRVIRRGHDDAHGPKDYLHSYARTLPLQGRREEVHVAARDGQPERVATVAVSFAAVLVTPPQRVKRGLYVKRPLRLWVVRVAEVEAPVGAEPLEWILLTDQGGAPRRRTPGSGRGGTSVVGL